jgi:YesN/AraC family two-component response regulator
MPEMDGMTLLTKLTEQHSVLKSFIIPAYGQHEIHSDLEVIPIII